MTSPSTNVPSASPPVVLFFTDNGAGLGHLTRLLAVAKAAGGRFQPVFLTMSLGHPLLREAGMPCEYFPSYSVMGLTKAEWAEHLTARMAEVIEELAVDVVVVDHVAPPTSFGALRARTDGVKFVWSRRGLWTNGSNRGALAFTDHFDVVVEPGDLAGPIDMGSTATDRTNVRTVDPIVLVHPDEYLPREEAREVLGLPKTGRAVLLQIGDSKPSRLRKHRALIRDAIAAVAGPDPVHLFAPLHPLQTESGNDVRGIQFAPVYPVARYYRAFDAVVSNSGYNSFHEIVLSGLPALFVPRDARIDDQERRARFGALCGRARSLPSFDDGSLTSAVERLLSSAEKQIAAATAVQLGTMNGASQFADLLSELTSDPGGIQQARVSALDAPAGPLPVLSDPHASPWDDADPPILLVATDHDGPAIQSLVDEILELRSRGPLAPAILATRIDASEAAGQAGLVFEGIMDEVGWRRLGRADDYPSFVRRRLDGMVERYSPRAVVVLEPGKPLSGELRSLLLGRRPATTNRAG